MDLKCEFHQINFKDFYGFKDHMANKHDVIVDKSNKFANKKCSICSKSFSYNYQRIQHLINDHNEDLNLIEKIFNTIEEFNDWKSEEEKLTSSFYVTFSKSSSHVFNCNRNPVSADKKRILKEKGKRKIKSSGYRHLEEDVCPSQITLRAADNGKFMMKYYKKHMGHICEQAKENLKKSDDTMEFNDYWNNDDEITDVADESNVFNGSNKCSNEECIMDSNIKEGECLINLIKTKLKLVEIELNNLKADDMNKNKYTVIKKQLNDLKTSINLKPNQLSEDFIRSPSKRFRMENQNRKY